MVMPADSSCEKCIFVLELAVKEVQKVSVRRLKQLKEAQNAAQGPFVACLGVKKASSQKTDPGSQPPPRMLQKLWGSAGGFCRSRKPAEEPSHRTPNVLLNFGNHAQLSRPCTILLPMYRVFSTILCFGITILAKMITKLNP